MAKKKLTNTAGRRDEKIRVKYGCSPSLAAPIRVSPMKNKSRSKKGKG